MMLTFQELFAGILLKEGLVHDRPRKVVDHEVQDWLDLFLSVTSVMCEGVILLLLVQYK